MPSALAPTIGRVSSKRRQGTGGARALARPRPLEAALETVEAAEEMLHRDAHVLEHEAAVPERRVDSSDDDVHVGEAAVPRARRADETGHG
jgi:hypothetical protein